jgi:hypothetical protein
VKRLGASGGWRAALEVDELGHTTFHAAWSWLYGYTRRFSIHSPCINHQSILFLALIFILIAYCFRKFTRSRGGQDYVSISNLSPNFAILAATNSKDFPPKLGIKIKSQYGIFPKSPR